MSKCVDTEDDNKGIVDFPFLSNDWKKLSAALCLNMLPQS